MQTLFARDTYTAEIIYYSSSHFLVIYSILAIESNKCSAFLGLSNK